MLRVLGFWVCGLGRKLYPNCEGDKSGTWDYLLQNKGLRV